MHVEDETATEKRVVGGFSSGIHARLEPATASELEGCVPTYGFEPIRPERFAVTKAGRPRECLFGDDTVAAYCHLTQTRRGQRVQRHGNAGTLSARLHENVGHFASGMKQLYGATNLVRPTRSPWSEVDIAGESLRNGGRRVDTQCDDRGCHRK